MVGKVTSGASFSGLAAYLTGDRERVAWTEARWMIGTDPKEIAREMEAAAGQSSRVEKPVYHISLSFDPADAPTREQMREAAGEVLKDLGLAEHQAFLVAHQDKGHPHVHIMVNRVHPETGKAQPVRYDYAQVERTLRRLEREWGLRRVPGHHAREPETAPPDRSQARTTGEIRRTRRTGEQPFPDVVRDKIGRDVAAAKSWSELTEAFKQYGLRVEARGRGMVITDGQRFAAASRVTREASRYRLERRFGQTLSDYLAKDRPAIPNRGELQPGTDGPLTEVRSGVPGGAWPAYHALQDLLSTKRLQEEPEKEILQRTGRAALQAARALVGDPALRKLYEDVQSYEQVQSTEAVLQQALRVYNTAEGRLKEMPEMERRAAQLSSAFDRELARVYRDPQAARQAFDAMEKTDGPAAAAQTLSSRPEHFGAVVADERKKWMGLATETSKASANRATRSAVEIGEQYMKARSSIPSKEEVASLRAAVQETGKEVRHLQRELRRGPHSGKLLKRMGEQAAKLSPRQVNRLQQVLTPKQLSEVMQAVGRAMELGRGRG